MNPLVSVVLPVCNGQETLADALQSIAEQTLTDHEVVVVVNGCTDDTLSIAERFSRGDERVRVVVLEEAGLVPALNRGIAEARAPLIARLDADDRMMPERLASQVRLLDDRPDWTVVACGVRHSPGAHDPGAGMQRHVEWLNSLRTPDAIRQARFIDSPVAHPSVAFRKEVIAELGGYRNGDFPEDYELWLRVMEAGKTIGHDDEVLVEWRDSAGRLTRTDSRYRADAHRALRHRYLVFGPLAAGRHARVWGAGPFGRKHAGGLRRAGVPVDDLIDIDPRKIGRVVAGGLPVVGIDTLTGPDGRLVLLCVGSSGAREEMVQVLAARGYRAERDYLPLQ
ncbi:MAG: glycosyltransferase [Deltaproteobacteria bacterium]|nr:glycosyltransferase [Deltaproteobacteria bacterium]